MPCFPLPPSRACEACGQVQGHGYTVPLSFQWHNSEQDMACSYPSPSHPQCFKTPLLQDSSLPPCISHHEQRARGAEAQMQVPSGNPHGRTPEALGTSLPPCQDFDVLCILNLLIYPPLNLVSFKAQEESLETSLPAFEASRKAMVGVLDSLASARLHLGAEDGTRLWGESLL